jgi:hypothetical protein
LERVLGTFFHAKPIHGNEHDWSPFSVFFSQLPFTLPMDRLAKFFVEVWGWADYRPGVRRMNTAVGRFRRTINGWNTEACATPFVSASSQTCGLLAFILTA